MKLNLLSGSVTIGSKRLPLLWTGQNAKHLAERNMEDVYRHPYLHVEAQQWAGRCVYTPGRNYGFAKHSAFEVVVCPVIKRRNFVILKSCFLKAIQNLPAAERNTLRGVDKKLNIDWDAKDLALLQEHNISKNQLEADIKKLFSKSSPKNRKKKK